MKSDLRCCSKCRIHCQLSVPLPAAVRAEPVECCEPTFTAVNCPQVSRVPSPKRCQPIHPGQGGLQHRALRCCLRAPPVLGTGESCSTHTECACARNVSSPHGYYCTSLDNKKSVKTCKRGSKYLHSNVC